MAARLAKWSTRYPKLIAWVEGNIEQRHTSYCLPRQHHKHPNSANIGIFQ